MTLKVHWGWWGLEKTRGVGTRLDATGAETGGLGAVGVGEPVELGQGREGHGAGIREAMAIVWATELGWTSVGRSVPGGPLTLWPPPGLVELLNRVQSSGAHDQRGLLRKEDLVLPEFLQLPAQGSTSQEAPQQTESSAQPKGGTSDSTAHSVL